MTDDSRYRSRRFILSSAALILGFVVTMAGRDVTGFAWLVGGILGGYGFTRSKFAGGDK